MKMKYLLLMISLTVTSITFAQNKVQNPGCEQSLTGVHIPGWQVITGGAWSRQCANPTAHGGECYFFAGDVAEAELSQRIDVRMLSF